MIKQVKNTNRIAKVNSLIKHQLGPILHELLQDQQGLVTISKVETSGDSRWAKVWLSILGGDQFQSKNNLEARLPHPSLDELGTPSPLNTSGRGKKGLTVLDEKILKTINRNIYFIQGELNKHFKAKIIPRLQFFLDTSPRYVEHIEEVIKKMHGEDESI